MGKIKVTMHYFIVYRALSVMYGSYEYGTEKGQDDPAGTQWYHCFKHILIANFFENFQVYLCL